MLKVNLTIGKQPKENTSIKQQQNIKEGIDNVIGFVILYQI